MKTVLFLCSGNYYRSRFAEVFFNWHAQRRGLGWRAESRGLAISPRNPGPISPHTLTRLAKHRVACESLARFPLDVASEDFAQADRVVAVKRTEHLPLMQQRFPAWVDQVEYWEVHDIDCSTPDEALPHLERHILQLLDRLTSAAAA